MDTSSCMPLPIGSSWQKILHNVCNFFAALTTKNTPDLQEQNFAAADAALLFDTYGNAILRLAYSYLHNMADAEEILQDTLLKYLQKEPKLATQEHQKAWLLHVAANLCKNKLQYNKLRQAADIDELSEQLADEKQDSLSCIWQAVKALPIHYREAVHLFYYEGYSTAEIANILARKESSVRSDLYRAREKLKTLLKDVTDFA